MKKYSFLTARFKLREYFFGHRLWTKKAKFSTLCAQISRSMRLWIFWEFLVWATLTTSNECQQNRKYLHAVIVFCMIANRSTLNPQCHEELCMIHLTHSCFCAYSRDNHNSAMFCYGVLVMITEFWSAWWVLWGNAYQRVRVSCTT